MMQRLEPICLRSANITTRIAARSPSHSLLSWSATLQDVSSFQIEVACLLSAEAVPASGLGTAPSLKIFTMPVMLAVAATLHCIGALLLALAVPYPAFIFGLFLMGLGGKAPLPIQSTAYSLLIRWSDRSCHVFSASSAWHRYPDEPYLFFLQCELTLSPIVSV